MSADSPPTEAANPSNQPPVLPLWIRQIGLQLLQLKSSLISLRGQLSSTLEQVQASLKGEEFLHFLVSIHFDLDQDIEFLSLLSNSESVKLEFGAYLNKRNAEEAQGLGGGETASHGQRMTQMSQMKDALAQLHGEFSYLLAQVLQTGSIELFNEFVYSIGLTQEIYMPLLQLAMTRINQPGLLNLFSDPSSANNLSNNSKNPVNNNNPNKNTSFYGDGKKPQHQHHQNSVSLKARRAMLPPKVYIYIYIYIYYMRNIISI